MSLSFRDPSGHVEDDGARIWRHVRPEAAEATHSLLASELYASLCRDGLLIPATEHPALEGGGLLLEHARVRWPSYPFEWTPGMLADAALLTLDIQARAWAQGWTLKDAAANNVLFDGPQPRFCDLLSLRQRRDDDAPGWEAYGQFVRHFVLPLLAVAELGRSPRDIFLAHRDGLKAAEVASYVPWHAQWNLAMLLHVRLPARLERRRIAHTEQKPGPARSGRPAADSTPWLLKNLRGFVERLAAACRGTSTWSEYTVNRDHYGDAELQAKRAAVAQILASRPYAQVLDVGANSGEFSRLAVAQGAQVLALDDDLNALEDLHRQARAERLPIQCLHANMARPTPATGWRLAETLDLPARLHQQFDLVLMLAVVHHLAVTERLPLAQLFETVAGYCRDGRGQLLIEFVPRDDPRFIEIAAANLALYEGWSREAFVAAAAPWFSVTQSIRISEQRELLLLTRR